MKEQTIIKNALAEMAQVMNATSGEAFHIRDADTLLIMERRLNDSDLKKQLQVYNAIFSKQHGADVSDITSSAVAYIKIKVLLEAELTDFEAKSYRALIKECKTFADKTTNIIRLSKTHALTAEDFQKEMIEETISKNEAFIQALNDTIEEVEERIARLPKPLMSEEEEFDLADEPEPEEHIQLKEKVQTQKGDKVSHSLMDLITAKKNAKQVEDKLKQVQMEESDTSCVEIPFYDKALVATEIIHCKDLGRYVILKRKDNVYFGLKMNLKGYHYDNSDGSLIELTEVSEEFLQFMSVDLLSEEYELHPFSKDEKTGMQMYFNFVSDCFEKHIGVTLTVGEYLNFKSYYNRLVCRVFKLEEQKHKDYYRALPLAEEYMEIMNAYNMVYHESKRQIVEAIIKEESQEYVENLRLIIAHHVVDKGSRKALEHLIEALVFFRDEEHFKEDEKTKEMMETTATPYVMPTMGFVPQLSLMSPGMPLIGNVYLTMQCLDENRQIVDEAFFATANMTQAMRDYSNRQAFIKRIGLVQDGQFVQLMSSEEGEF